MVVQIVVIEEQRKRYQLGLTSEFSLSQVICYSSGFFAIVVKRVVLEVDL